MDWRDYIAVEANICHGQACVTGTRIPVAVVLDNLAAHLGPEEILRSYPGLTREAVARTMAGPAAGAGTARAAPDGSLPS